VSFRLEQQFSVMSNTTEAFEEDDEFEEFEEGKVVYGLLD
jgi:hypothetical protein